MMNQPPKILCDAERLCVEAMKIHDKLPNNLKRAIGGPLVRCVVEGGAAIMAGYRATYSQAKERNYAEAQEYLDRVEFIMEAVLVTNKISAAEKAVFDNRFLEVQRQLRGLRNSLNNKTRPIPSGNTGGESLR